MWTSATAAGSRPVPGRPAARLLTQEERPYESGREILGLFAEELPRKRSLDAFRPPPGSDCGTRDSNGSPLSKC